MLFCANIFALPYSKKSFEGIILLFLYKSYFISLSPLSPKIILLVETIWINDFPYKAYDSVLSWFLTADANLFEVVYQLLSTKTKFTASVEASYKMFTTLVNII